MGSCQSANSSAIASPKEIVQATKPSVTGNEYKEQNGAIDKGDKKKKGEGTSHDENSKCSSVSFTEPSNIENNNNHNAKAIPRAESFTSGASTPPDDRSEDGSMTSTRRKNSQLNPKSLVRGSSIVGLDEMIEDRKEVGVLHQNVVHFEVPFGKPIEEVYEGVHNGPVLGSGISGMVRLVRHKATGLKYAVKVLDLGLVETAEGLEQLREEIFIMCQLDHPNIVRLEEVYESHNEIYLVQELCLGGELFDRLDEQPDYHYTEAECARLVKQMLSAVRYLHTKGIIHRDLKLENFLFSSTAKDSELKMIDFGLSKHFRYGEVHHDAVGTPYTVAPEVIRGCYDERCDVWAIGVITFLLLSGDPPFGGCGGPEPLMTVRSNILKGSFAFKPEDVWDNVSETARDFIKKLLVTDPKDRPTAKQAQKHAWLLEWANRERTGKDNVLNPNVVKALVSFKEYSDMRKLLCEVLSFTLLPDQIKDLRREFEKMDTDGSGEISLSALKQVLMTNAGAGSLGALTEEEVEDIFNAMRVRKTETRIHWHEFIAAGLSQCQVDDRNLRLAFERLDSDHKGYITLDDIMDLMGSDAVQSEEAISRMWGDSIKACRCQHARITYQDFLRLMKGQTVDVVQKEASSVELKNGSIVNSFVMPARLEAVPEGVATMEEHPSPVRQSDDDVDSLGAGQPFAEVNVGSGDLGGADRTPPMISHSAPSTPADHKLILDLDQIGTPSTLNGSGALPFVPMDVTLPALGMQDSDSSSSMPKLNLGLDMSRKYEVQSSRIVGEPDSINVRRRSRSIDDKDQEDSQGKGASYLNTMAGVVRDLMLPETDHAHVPKELDKVVKDETASALVVNRKLYRAHRQMRLAVMEASKRFEEQQAAHARDIILSLREAEGNTEQNNTGIIQAGLVMRHGHKKQVSSESIRKLLRESREQQQVMVEKANKRGGRGRRSRKKTISDMSGMLNSMGSGDLTGIAIAAAELENPNGAESERPQSQGSVDPSLVKSDASNLGSNAPVRGATVPGEFRKTSDPFGRQGRYGGRDENI